MEICQTERLVIRHFSESDAGFILQLLNSETFIEHIGDKKCKNPWRGSGIPKKRRHCQL